MCHSPLRHRLRLATPNTLGLGSWSTVSYFIQRQVPGYPPPADVPGGHSSPGLIAVASSVSSNALRLLSDRVDILALICFYDVWCPYGVPVEACSLICRLPLHGSVETLLLPLSFCYKLSWRGVLCRHCHNDSAGVNFCLGMMNHFSAPRIGQQIFVVTVCCV